jgi:hypothetical protein
MQRAKNKVANHVQTASNGTERHRTAPIVTERPRDILQIKINNDTLLFNDYKLSQTKQTEKFQHKQNTTQSRAGEWERSRVDSLNEVKNFMGGSVVDLVKR